MPNVGGKQFPYTAAGRAAAKRYKNRPNAGAGGVGGPRRGPGSASPSRRGSARPGMRRGPGAARPSGGGRGAGGLRRGPGRGRRPARPMKRRGTRY